MAQLANVLCAFMVKYSQVMSVNHDPVTDGPGNDCNDR